MSLLEDVLALLQSVLEYFGVPPDMLVPVWESQHCGQYRSIVRMIGTNLPLTPSPRVHFQIPYPPHGCVDVTMDTAAIPSLADVFWVSEDDGDSFAMIRNCVRRGGGRRPEMVGHQLHAPGLTQRGEVGDQGLAARPAQRGGVLLGKKSDPEALKKISVLEEELLKLRAQIALIVTTAPPSGSAHIHNVPGTPGPPMSPLPPPVLTSTPRSGPPPPPPPPPPLLVPVSAVGSSAMEVIRQRREASRLQPQGKGQASGQAGQLKPQAPAPSMLDVLKDLNQVQLRSVQRSPGGTPIKRRRSQKGVASLSDPAALIAEALRRKFSHFRHDDSYDKENRSAELSPFGSPETPQVPPSSRRSQGPLHL